MSRRRHTACRPGAAVRLHGYAPARVSSIERDEDGIVWAHCIITGRSHGWREKLIGPHGYRTGERVMVRASEAVPRDCIYIERGTFGRLSWHIFEVRAQ